MLDWYHSVQTFTYFIGDIVFSALIKTWIKDK